MAGSRGRVEYSLWTRIPDFESYSFRWEVNIEQDEAHTTQPWDEATGNTTQKAPVVDGPDKALRREEWKDRLLVLKNNAIAIAGIFVLQVRTEQCAVHLCVCRRAGFDASQERYLKRVERIFRNKCGCSFCGGTCGAQEQCESHCVRREQIVVYVCFCFEVYLRESRVSVEPSAGAV
jgi:hypothetical protein